MEMKTFKVGDFKRLLAESSNEFNAKLGSGVESANKSNNGKAYTDAKKRAKDYDGGLSDAKNPDRIAKYEKTDGNKTLLDYNIDNATPEYKKRVHANVKGFSSEQEMNNGIEKVGDRDNNEKVYQQFKKDGEEVQKKELANKTKGLTASKLPKDVFEKENMYESYDGFNMRAMINDLKAITENQEKPDTSHIKTIYFKKTEFLNETHMISRIPDDFKQEGNVFKMKDKNGSEYLLEWKYNKPVVMEHTNKNGAAESIDRMKTLFDYKTSDTKTSFSSRLNENDEMYADTLNKMRRIIK